MRSIHSKTPSQLLQILNLKSPLPPTPNIQTDLNTSRNRQTSMNSLPHSPPLLIKIQPKDSSALPRPKRNPLPLSIFITLNKRTPLPALPLQHRKLRPTPLAPLRLTSQVNHKTRSAPTISPRRTPIVVLSIVPGDVVALGPQALDVSVGRPALEGQGAGFDALHERRAREEGFVGFAHVGVCAFGGAGVDCRGLPVGGADMGKDGG